MQRLHTALEELLNGQGSEDEKKEKEEDAEEHPAKKTESLVSCSFGTTDIIFVESSQSSQPSALVPGPDSSGSEASTVCKLFIIFLQNKLAMYFS